MRIQNGQKALKIPENVYLLIDLLCSKSVYRSCNHHYQSNGQLKRGPSHLDFLTFRSQKLILETGYHEYKL